MVIAAVLAAVISLFLPGQRWCVAIFAALFASNGWWLEAFHGQESLFQACIWAEFFIAFGVHGFKHRVAEWIVITSFALAVVHLLAWAGFHFDAFDQIYQRWDVIVPGIEAGQIVGIIVASDPIFNRIAAKAARGKQPKKGVDTWSALIHEPR